MKDYLCQKHACVIETGKIQNMDISLKGMEEAMDYMEKTERLSIMLFTLCRVCMMGAMVTILLSLCRGMLGPMAMFFSTPPWHCQQ